MAICGHFKSDTVPYKAQFVRRAWITAIAFQRKFFPSSIIQLFFPDKLIHQGEDLRVAAEIAGLDVGAVVVQVRLKGGDDLRPGDETR